MELAIKLALGPLLLAQGQYVRLRTPLLPEPEGARTGFDGAGPVLSLLITGDSAAAGVGVSLQRDALLGQLVQRLAQHRGLQWNLMAKTGATTLSTHAMLADSPQRPIDVIVTSLGVNDITSGVSMKDFISQQQALFTLLKQRFQPKLIVISGMPPVHRFPALPQPLRWYLGRQARLYDKALSTLVSAIDGCIHLPQPSDGPVDMMSADGFHPGAPVYARWARLAAAAIQKSLVEESKTLSTEALTD